MALAAQALKRLIKSSPPTRAEVTNPAMAERDECVMLNKGPTWCPRDDGRRLGLGGRPGAAEECPGGGQVPLFTEQYVDHLAETSIHAHL